MAKIKKDMTFNEVLRAYPDTVKVLRSHNMQCFGCLGAEAETIEMGAMAHGVDLGTLLDELNSAVKGS
jgi:hybrid cluster-associated redox disulfide protein